MKGYIGARFGELFQRAAAATALFALLTTFFLSVPVQAKASANLTKSFNNQLAVNLLASNTIVISEVDADTPLANTDTANEWFELHNVSAETITLTNWTITDNTSTDTIPTVTLGPGGHVIVAGTTAGFASEHPGFSGTVLAIADGAIGNGLANGGDRLILKDGSGVEIDALSWGSNTTVLNPAAGADGSTNTNQRNASGADTDTASDWSRATETPNGNTNAGGGNSTNPTATGSATPNTVAAGSSTLLTVTVTPGTNPISSGLTVIGNLSAIGGSASQQFFDDGTNGDQTAGDNIYSYNATVTANTTGGSKNIPVTVTDVQSRSGSATITLTVTSSSTSPTATGTANPSSVQAGNSTLLTVSVTPGTNPTSTGITVAVNLSSIGGSATQTFFDDGTNGDVTAGDNVFSYLATVTAGTASGGKSLAATVTDAQTRTANTTISLTVTPPPATGQPLPFSQNWSNTNLITANDDWSQVPGIVGYLGNYSADMPTGVDPQTLLTDFAPNDIDVIANQSNPDTLISGGVAEFEIANPTVALQGSGTADAPHLVISINTTGQDNITVSYNLRDIDGSDDTAIQPVALQYRIGSSGNYTNIPAAFVADASDGPNEASLVTPVNVALPAAVNNQSLVQLRIITTNAFGSDEWIGVDDINIASGGTIPLSASGSSSPVSVMPGSNALLRVTINPGTNPDSSGVTVTGDLTSIGGSSTQTFYDDGTNGDITANDNVYSYQAAVPAGTTTGAKSLPITVTDAQNRNANINIGLTVSTTGTVHSAEEHLVMGNPSNATTDVNNPFNYLLLKEQFVMSYHRDRAIPNWVSWHLDSTWLGNAPRQNDFRPDPSLPAGWYQVLGTSYSGSGFDRGHHTPSGDRTSSVADNSATFFMTNMMPQAPGNNQGPWEKLESYSRTQVGAGNELYIIMGGVGNGGTGDSGYAETIDMGRIAVPAQTWKVIIILPVGENDVSRVTAQTRTIAVIMPNNTAIRPDQWQKYITTVDQVEALTGYDFFSNVDPGIQAQIESKLDAANNTAPTASPQSKTTAEDAAVNITLTATDPNVNNQLTYTVVNNPSNGTLSGTGANLTYTPNANYFGTDTFTFKASDGTADSSTVTVTITVTGVNDAPVASGDSKTTPTDTTLIFAATDLTTNDNPGAANETGQTLTVAQVITTAQTHGTVSLSNGQVTYTPEAGYSGSAAFDYTVCDNGTTNGAPDVKCSTATVNVGVGQAASNSISGTVFYGTTPTGDPAKFVPGVTLNAAGMPPASTTTATNGTYTLSGLGGGPYTVTPSKTAQVTPDNNGISLQDASEVAKYVFNQRTFTANQLIAADATGNGTVTIQDASEIAKRAFNITSTNIVGQWKFVPPSRTYQSISGNLTGQDYDAILVGDVTGNWTPPPPPANRPEINEKANNEKSEKLLGINNQSFSLPAENNQQKAVQPIKKLIDEIPVSLQGADISGKTLLIPVMVGDLTDQGVTAYDFTVSYDPNVLQPDLSAYDSSGTLTETGGFIVLVDSNQYGRLRIGAFGAAPLSGKGTLIYLRFNVLSKTRPTLPLDFKQFVFGEGGEWDPKSVTNNSFEKSIRHRQTH